MKDLVFNKFIIFVFLLPVSLFFGVHSVAAYDYCDKLPNPCSSGKELYRVAQGTNCPDSTRCEKSPTPCALGITRPVHVEQCCCEPGVISSLQCGSRGCDINNDKCPTSCPCTHFSDGDWCGERSSTAPRCDVCGCKIDNSDCSRECNSQCKECITPGKKYKKGGAWTALGCIPTGDFTDFTAWLLRRIVAIAGGIAFLLVIAGGFKIITSAGDPKGVQAAKETITSALIGLLFIIFSVFLLELIGVKILGIPGL